jgi:hypothetical protein
MVFLRDGQVYAKCTIVALLVWLATYMLTQSTALFGTIRFLRWGLAGGAFTTAIVSTLSLILFARYLRERRRVPAAAVATATSPGTLVIESAFIELLPCNGIVGARTTGGQQDAEITYAGAYNPQYEGFRHRATFVSL